MDINVLALNVGNSRVAIGAFVSGELLEVRRVPCSNQAELKTAIVEIFNRIARDDAAVVAASVNPAIHQLLEQITFEVTNRSIQWIGRQIDAPDAVRTVEPDQTGIDRILNAAAAYEQIGKACVVVDAGTALTVDLCADNGDFLGGAILPGASMMLEALKEKTARLPLVTLARPSGAYGDSTESAILHGVFYGLRGAVKELVEQYATELGSWPDIIATGGDADLLFGGWELIHAIAPDLTLYGIASAYAEHHIKHGT